MSRAQKRILNELEEIKKDPPSNCNWTQMIIFLNGMGL